MIKFGLAMLGVLSLLGGSYWATSPEPELSQLGAVEPGSSDPGGRVLVLDGDFDVSALSGSDVVLWFWAPWCPHCAESASQVATLNAEYPEVLILGVGLDGTAEELAAFVTSNGASDMPHLSGATSWPLVSALMTEYQVTTIPTFVVRQDNGEVRNRAGFDRGGLRNDLDWLISN